MRSPPSRLRPAHSAMHLPCTAVLISMSQMLLRRRARARPYPACTQRSAVYLPRKAHRTSAPIRRSCGDAPTTYHAHAKGIAVHLPRKAGSIRSVTAHEATRSRSPPTTPAPIPARCTPRDAGDSSTCTRCPAATRSPSPRTTPALTCAQRSAVHCHVRQAISQRQ
jgi:hypothetical protein